jgi:hypothetical protein
MNELGFAFVIALVVAGFIVAALLILYLPDACSCPQFELVPDSAVPESLLLAPGAISDAEGVVRLGGQRLRLQKDGRLWLEDQEQEQDEQKQTLMRTQTRTTDHEQRLDGDPVLLVRPRGSAELCLAAGSRYLYTMDGRKFARVRTTSAVAGLAAAPVHLAGGP